ncbi:hypothetical protein OfM1_19960 [Lactovum odontotermitis]
MGLFDFFKDGDDYEGAHSSRSSSSKRTTFDASKFDNNADLIAWLEKNEVILLSEDEGLVVYTNNDDESFLQLYTSAAEAKDEELNEYVEVNAQDLRDLLDEMPDVAYFVLNPASDNILIQRDEMLQQQIPADFEQSRKKDFPEIKEREEKTDESVNVPSDAETVSEIKTESALDADFSTQAPLEFPSAEDEAETVTVVKSDEITEASQETQETRESDEVNLEQIVDEDEKEIKNHMNFEAAANVPQSIITLTLSLAESGVQKFYLAQKNQGDFTSLCYLAGTEHDIDFGNTVEGVSFYWKDGSEEALAIENDEFLIFDKNTAKQLAENFSESNVLHYFKNHPIIYTLPIQQSENGSNELIAFSDFSQIPELFLNAFDSFELASLQKFKEFLQSEEEQVNVVHLNLFTSSLYLKPEAFSINAVQSEPSKEFDDLTIEVEDKKAGINQVLEILKDFDISKISLAEDNHVSFTFRNGQDSVIAKQILRMKTDLKV